jgi:phosphoglycolate phosphatase
MLIIFDWDGTLSDSATKIITCMQEAAVRVQLPVLGDEPIRNIIGLGLPEAIRRLYPDIDPAGVAAMQNAYSQVFVGSGQGEPPFFDGAREAVEGLLAQGHTLAVATGKSRKGLDRVLAESGWHRYFHTSRCADETASKPHPLML